MSQTTGLPLLQCCQCKISIINWWLNKDNILFPNRPPRLWSWSFSAAIFIRPQLAERTTPPAGAVALVACPAPQDKNIHILLVALLTFWVFFLTPLIIVLFGVCGVHARSGRRAGQNVFFKARNERADVGLEWFIKNCSVWPINECVPIHRPLFYFLIVDLHSDTTCCLFLSKVRFIDEKSHVGPGSVVCRPS